MRNLPLGVTCALLALAPAANAEPRLSIHRAAHALAVCEKTWETSDYTVLKRRRGSRTVVHLRVRERFDENYLSDEPIELDGVFTVKLQRGHPRIYNDLISTANCRWGVPD